MRTQNSRTNQKIGSTQNKKEQQTAKTRMSDIPGDVLNHISSYLSPKNVAILRMTYKNARDIGKVGNADPIKTTYSKEVLAKLVDNIQTMHPCIMKLTKPTMTAYSIFDSNDTRWMWNADKDYVQMSNFIDWDGKDPKKYWSSVGWSVAKMDSEEIVVLLNNLKQIMPTQSQKRKFPNLLSVINYNLALIERYKSYL